MHHRAFDWSEAAQADVFDVPSWSRQLDGAVGVISCLGGFGTNEAMFKVCSLSTVQGSCVCLQHSNRVS